METTKNCIWDTLYTKSCKFEVAKDLLDLAQTGDAEATFQIGMQALQEERLGYATIFLQLAA
ncbi:MAG: hypothetical protein KAT71_07960, partial [Gammaproteobacteria bacterium]|nr:hypothetical protein [Gammaproteobacteria bacterium]